MLKLVLILTITIQIMGPSKAAAQRSVGAICDTAFKRPTYPTRQAFCSLGDLVEDAYDPGTFHSCENMEVDHLVSLRYAHRNGICDPNDLRRLANDPNNLRLTYWRTNRSKATLSPEEFAVRKLSPATAEMVLKDAEALRVSFGLPSLSLTPEIRSGWLLQERNDLRRQNARLIESADAIRNRQVLYRGQTMRAADAVSNHAGRVTRRITVSSLRNLGSMAAESLPAIGVTAIVGVTALELRDACEALKDVQELNLAFNPGSAPIEEASTVCSLEVPSADDLRARIKQYPNQAWDAARSYSATLPTIDQIEIDWTDYFSTVKAGADWIIAETGSTTASFLSAVGQAFGQFEIPELPKLPWQ